MIDTQHKVSCHFRFIEQLICPDLFVQTALSTTGKVTAKLKEIEQTFCTPFNRQRTPVCNHVPVLPLVISLTVIVQPRFQSVRSLLFRETIFLS